MKLFSILDFRFWILAVSRQARGLLVLPVVVWMGSLTPLSAALTVRDADGVERRLDQPGRVTAVIYSNPALQEWTRKAGASLDKFQGRAAFRAVVVVDLRGTMADWAPGYTTRRMQRDLDAEARRVTPSYRTNGNPADPRPQMSAVPDFKGEASRALGWEVPGDRKRVVVFGKDGKVVFRSDDAVEFSGLQQAVARALEAAE